MCGAAPTLLAPSRTKGKYGSVRRRDEGGGGQDRSPSSASGSRHAATHPGENVHVVFVGRSSAAQTRLFYIQSNFIDTASVTIEDVFTGTQSLTPAPRPPTAQTSKYCL